MTKLSISNFEHPPFIDFTSTPPQDVAINKQRRTHIQHLFQALSKYWFKLVQLDCTQM